MKIVVRQKKREFKVFSRSFFLGILLAPLILSLAWCRHEGISDFLDLKYLFILGLNLFTAYPDFLFHFAVTYIIVSNGKWSVPRGYFLVIGILSIIIFVILKFHYLRGIDGLGYSRIVFLKSGNITKAGFEYLLSEGFFNTVGHLGAMWIMWFVGGANTVAEVIRIR